MLELIYLSFNIFSCICVCYCTCFIVMLCRLLSSLSLYEMWTVFAYFNGEFGGE